MNDRDTHLKLGMGAIAAAVFLLAFMIPNFVSTPKNVPNIVLSPLFCLNTLACLTALTGLGLIWSALRLPKDDSTAESDVDDKQAAFLRLLGIAAIMLVTMYAMPKVGLVWTAMFAFAATAFLVRTRNPVAALVSAVLVPLCLYFFFAHVAGVAIPQGDFVRLP